MKNKNKAQLYSPNFKVVEFDLFRLKKDSTVAKNATVKESLTVQTEVPYKVLNHDFKGLEDCHD